MLLESRDAKSRVSASTDTSGSFHFDSVADGEYRVTISAKGFAAWHIKESRQASRIGKGTSPATEWELRATPSGTRPPMATG